MPEGDTIHRAARTLDQALRGRTVTKFDTNLPRLKRIDDDAPVAGRTIENVRAHGKHLIIELTGGLRLRTHMRMKGSWHVYRPGERWQRARSAMTVMLATDAWVAVGFDIPVAEFEPGGERMSRPLRDLGPDLLSEEFDAEVAVTRIRARAGQEVGDALLDQSVVAGIGNIWKSEVLFVCRIDPFARIESLDDAQLRAIVSAARTLLRRSVEGEAGARSVYGRGGKPCRRCGAVIATTRQGADARVTYWCPRCQR